MAQFSRNPPFGSFSRATESHSNRSGASAAASYAQLVHDRRILFLKNKTPQKVSLENDLDAAISSYNKAMGEILEGLKDKIDQYSAEDLEILTPQKLILDEVDTVRCLILKASMKLENSPAVKKVEEERKMRILMSMRHLTSHEGTFSKSTALLQNASAKGGQFCCW